MQSHENRLIRKPEVRAKTGFSNSALDREVRAGRFPAPIRLSSDPRTRAVGWSLREIDEWIERRFAEARSRASA